MLLADGGGNVIDWIMQNDGLAGWNTVGNTNAYSIAGTGDFSGNGTSDILLANGGGNVIDWMLQNGVYKSWNDIGGALGYSIVGTGDFSGNGIDDVLLENGGGNVADWICRTAPTADWNEDGAPRATASSAPAISAATARPTSCWRTRAAMSSTG